MSFTSTFFSVVSFIFLHFNFEWQKSIKKKHSIFSQERSPLTWKHEIWNESTNAKAYFEQDEKNGKMNTGNKLEFYYEIKIFSCATMSAEAMCHYHESFSSFVWCGFILNQIRPFVKRSQIAFLPSCLAKMHFFIIDVYGKSSSSCLVEHKNIFLLFSRRKKNRNLSYLFMHRCQLRRGNN